MRIIPPLWTGSFLRFRLRPALEETKVRPESISRSRRIAWLADHPLPRDRTYFSVVAFAEDAHISWPLEHSHQQLSTIDARNDGQVLFTDAIIPGSHLLAYVNADHWALALPLARNVPALRPMFRGRNDYPREILLEAIVRSVEEQLGLSGGSQQPTVFKSQKGAKSSKGGLSR